MKTIVAFALSLLLLNTNTAFAESVPDFANLFGGILRSAITQQARLRKLPPVITRFEAGVNNQRSVYAVDGLSLGGQVRFDSAAYRKYQCSPSDQFAGFTFCRKRQVDHEARGRYTSFYSILHSADGTAVYVNRDLEPAFLRSNEAIEEIERLSRRFGSQPKVITMPRPGFVDGIIASWGGVVLEPLDPTSTAELAAGKNVSRGFLLDFLDDFQRSAQTGLPIYRLTGNAGYIWAASFNRNGIGTNRFLAIDASMFMPPIISQRTPDVPTLPPVVPPKPTDPAVDLFRNTKIQADKGNAQAQFSLATMYAEGRGVVQNNSQAMVWFRKAAEQKHPRAQKTLGDLYASGRGTPEDRLLAVAWYKKAAEQGNADAQYILGARYEGGQGVDRDIAQALDWYQRAASQGQPDATKRLTDATSITEWLRATRKAIQERHANLTVESQKQVEETAAQIAAANEKMPLADLKALQAEANVAVSIIQDADEFVRVSEIAIKRVVAIEVQLQKITSDDPIVEEIQTAIINLKSAQTGSSLSQLQDALGKLIKLYDKNSNWLRNHEFKAL